MSSRLPDAEAAEPLADQASAAILGANPFVGFDRTRLVADAVEWMGRVALRPPALVGEAARTAAELGRVVAGRSDVHPADGDRRFADPAWTRNPFYRRLLQGYLALTAAAHRLVDQAGLDEPARQRAHFGVTLLADALAPTNALTSNPAALKQAFDTAGLSLLRGARNLTRDLGTTGMPATVDTRPFEAGGNLAVSPGAVVYRDEVCELIQYLPSTETVHARPLVVIPPQINKFYVLDLAPGRSFTEFAVAGGIPYFAISWRNPTAAQREWGLDTYVEACVKAVDAACQITGADAANVMGLCAGGVTMTLLLAYLAEVAPARIASATLAVAMLDMRSPSMMSMFASDAVIAAALRRSRRKGVLDGAEMARVFAWMRPNDLVWNYWVNNYLLGNDPPAFDILYWNADTTRLPAELHEGFLDLYVRNPLPEAGELSILGSDVDLRQVKAPVYVVAGVTDHIVPWQAAYEATRLFGGPCEFVLSSSGHIQSIVNPPGNPKASYFIGGPLHGDAEHWRRGAQKAAGSWWEHWLGWVQGRSGERRPAPRRLGSRRFRPLEPAPGTYVHQR